MSKTKHKIAVLKTVFTQPGDSCGPECTYQELTIETMDAGAGPFCVISTQRWAIESEQEIEFIVAAIRNAIKQEIYK